MVDTDDTEDETVATAADQLYAAAVDDFMAVRGELAKAAKADGNPAAAKAITALRKPTVAASVVNRLTLADPSVRDRLGELGDRLRRAHHDLDAAVLRELTTERRTTVAEVTVAALAHADRDDPPTALRDEVSATFDAAVADPDVAQRLGRLVRSESFSGFGVAMDSPGLTLVQGGKGTRPKAAAKTPAKAPAKTPAERQSGTTSKHSPAPAEPSVPAATTRRLTRRLDKARTDFETADGQFTAAEQSQQHEHDRVATLTDELAQVQRELDEAKRALDRSRREVRITRGRRREARSALDRAERALERGAD